MALPVKRTQPGLHSVKLIVVPEWATFTPEPLNWHRLAGQRRSPPSTDARPRIHGTVLSNGSAGAPHQHFRGKSLQASCFWDLDVSPGQQLEPQQHPLRGPVPVSAVVESLLLLRCLATGTTTSVELSMNSHPTRHSGQQTCRGQSAGIRCAYVNNMFGVGQPSNLRGRTCHRDGLPRPNQDSGWPACCQLARGIRGRKQHLLLRHRSWALAELEPEGWWDGAAKMKDESEAIPIHGQSWWQRVAGWVRGGAVEPSPSWSMQGARLCVLYSGQKPSRVTNVCDRGPAEIRRCVLVVAMEGDVVDRRGIR